MEETVWAESSPHYMVLNLVHGGGVYAVTVCWMGGISTAKLIGQIFQIYWKTMDSQRCSGFISPSDCRCMPSNITGQRLWWLEAVYYLAHSTVWVPLASEPWRSFLNIIAIPLVCVLNLWDSFWIWRLGRKTFHPRSLDFNISSLRTRRLLILT